MFPLGVLVVHVCSAGYSVLMKRLEFCGHFCVFVDFVLAFFFKKGFLFPDFLNHMVTKPLFLNFFFLSFGNTGWSLTDFPVYGHSGKKQISSLRKEREGKNPSFYVFKKNIVLKKTLGPFFLGHLV